MNSQVIEQREKKCIQQTPLFFPIKPQEKIIQSLIAHNLNFPLISQYSYSRPDQNQKTKLFQHDEDYNNVRIGREVIDNSRKQSILNKVTDFDSSPKEYKLIECYIKSKQQKYDELIENNLDIFRNLDGNSHRVATEQNEVSQIRRTSINHQLLNNHPKIKQYTEENIEQQKNKHQIFLKKKFKQKVSQAERRLLQKTQNCEINLDSSNEHSKPDIYASKTVILRHSKPQFQSEQFKFKNHFIFQKQIARPTLTKNKKLRIFVFVIIAVLKLSKRYKQIFEKREIARVHFQSQQEPHIKFINFFGIKQYKTQHRKFVDSLLQKIITLFKEQIYITECSNIQKLKVEMRKDFKKQRLCFLMQILLQNLELITRKSIIPEFILHSLNLCLFSGKQTQTSQFVVNRTKFYSKTVHFLNSQQKTLIALEYLIFTIIIPNIIDIANELDKSNEDWYFITVFHLIAIIGILMVSFTKYFQKLNHLRKSNVKPIQRVIQFKKNNQGLPQSIIFSISDKIEENEDKIISGGFELSSILELFEQKPFWREKISQQFSKIVINIGGLIDITNAS